MHVIPKEQYRQLTRPSLQSPISLEAAQSSLPAAHSSLPAAQSSVCSVCGRDFKHPNILAHHMKEHTGPKCNICGKSFKHRDSLRKHLTRHPPQAGPGAEPPATRAGPFGAWAGPPAARAGPPAARAGPPAGTGRTGPPPELRCSICDKKMKHKRNLTRHMKSHITDLPFKATKWETL